MRRDMSGREAESTFKGYEQEEPDRGQENDRITKRNSDDATNDKGGAKDEANALAFFFVTFSQSEMRDVGCVSDKIQNVSIISAKLC